MESARPARADDAPRVVELALGLRAELGTFRGGDLWARSQERPLRDAASFDALCRDPAVSVIVGCLDHAVVGYALTRLEELPDGTRLGVIAEIYVEPDARSVGVGESMVELALQWCARHACLGVDATALPGHRAAKNFFEAHGFVARSLTMHRPLSPGPDA